MQKFSILSVVFICFLFIRCSKPSAEKDLISKFYNRSEIAELNRITDFIISEMSENCNKSSINCLYTYFDQFKDLRAADDVKLEFPLTNQKKIIESLDEKLFKDIWGYCVVEKGTTDHNAIHYKYLCINSNGRFSKFLIALTSKNVQLKRYGETLQLAGDFTPYMTATLLKQSERFDLQSKDEMFVVAVHLFTLNYSEPIK